MGSVKILYIFLLCINIFYFLEISTSTTRGGDVIASSLVLTQGRSHKYARQRMTHTHTHTHTYTHTHALTQRFKNIPSQAVRPISKPGQASTPAPTQLFTWSLCLTGVPDDFYSHAITSHLHYA